jgi:L-fucose isomerase-like protein
MEKAGASSATITCGPYIKDSEMPTPCMTLGLLQEAGMPAACQVDIDALLTMILFKRIGNMPSFMGNTFARDGKLGVQHCVTCRKMCGFEKKLYDYSISDFHGVKDAPTIHAFLPEERTVTVARLTRGLENMILTTGTLIDCRDAHTSPGRRRQCRNALIIKTDGLAQIMKAVAGRPQYHMIVAYGDHTEALSEFCREKGIGILRT